MKKPNIKGIIHNIIRFVDACRSSAAGMLDIFCIMNIDPPTRIGMMNGDGSGFAKSIQRNELSIGTTLCTSGIHPYRCRDNPTRLSGLEGTVCRMAW